MDAAIRDAIEQLRTDSTSGASELAPRAIAILREAERLWPDDIVDIAREVGRAQTSMASGWNAALAALRERRDPGALERFDRRRQRAGQALVRFAADHLVARGGGRHHGVTISFSGSVLACLRAAGRGGALMVSCAEGRPGLEGRRMAEAIAEAGIPVDFYSDAALGEALWRDGEGDAVVIVGADAVTPTWALNKVGTRMLAAAAAREGVPVYVAATRDKFMDARASRLLQVVEHDPRNLWNDSPTGITVRNAWFERVPMDLLTGVITDAGTLAPDMVTEACRAASADVSDEDIGRLLTEAADAHSRRR